MDTELARTFLVVVATGSFVDAAQRLHVTQSTVSTRIQRLEETLGAELFVRNKAGNDIDRRPGGSSSGTRPFSRAPWSRPDRRSASSAATAQP